MRRMIGCWLPALLVAVQMSFGVPTAAHAEAVAGCLISDPGTRLPIILVHGFNSTADTWAEDLTDLREVSTLAPAAFTYGDDPSRDLELSSHWVTEPDIGHALALQIACSAAASTAQGGRGKVFLVGHSMGGLAIRCALNETCNGGVTGVAAVVGAVVTFGTPNTGSFLRGGSIRSAAEDAVAPVLVATCRTASKATLGTLDDLCQTVSVLTSSDAARAFTVGSAQLGSLPAGPATVPWYSLAGRIKVTTSVGPFWTTTLAGDVGDLVVGTDSALATSNQVGELGGTTKLECGALDLSTTAAALGPLGLGLQAKNLGAGLTCSHVTQTRDDGFLAEVLGQINKLHNSVPATSTELLAYIKDGQPISATEFLEGAYYGPLEIWDDPLFTTPSGNIHCWFYPARLICSVSQFSFSPPPLQDCGTISWVEGFIRLYNGKLKRGTCTGDNFGPEISNPLPYGRTITYGGFACRSESAFLACAELAAGNGFVVSRTTFRGYGPTL